MTDLGGFPPLRAWQRRALVEYLRRRDEDFLAVATPGAGKTTFALRIAAELLADRTVEALTVVTPTEHLKGQWAAAAGAVGIGFGELCWRILEMSFGREDGVGTGEPGQAPASRARRPGEAP